MRAFESEPIPKVLPRFSPAKGSFDTQAVESTRRDLERPAVHNLRACVDLIRPHERSIYLLALAISADAKVAEEIVVEGSCRVVTHLRHNGQLNLLKAQLLESVISAGCDLVGITEGEPDVQWDSSIDTPWELSHLNADDHLVREVLMIALFTLPQLQRVVIVLRDFLRLTSTEISLLLGFPRVKITYALSCARFGLYLNLSTSILGTLQA
jgi:DNA-directed RNA polymerase specialized sigma24 family protein